MSEVRQAFKTTVIILVIVMTMMFVVDVISPTVQTQASLNSVNGGFMESTATTVATSGQTANYLFILGLVAIVTTWGVAGHAMYIQHKQKQNNKRAENTND